MKKLSLIAAVAALSLPGCVQVQQQGVSYSPPRAAAPTQVAVGAGTTTADIAADLTQAGLNVTRSTASYVESRGSGAAFVDCGTLTQTVLGNSARFAGASPQSVIYTDFDTLDLMTRYVDVAARVRVDLADGVAAVSERHTVTMRWQAGSGRSMGRQTATVTPGSVAAFGDGTSCTVSRYVTSALR